MGAAALREILSLYDFRESEQTRSVIAALTDVHSRHGTARLTFLEQPDPSRPAVRRSADYLRTVIV